MYEKKMMIAKVSCSQVITLSFVYSITTILKNFLKNAKSTTFWKEGKIVHYPTWAIYYAIYPTP